MIFLDTNIVSEMMRPEPAPGVVAWLERNDADLAMATIVLAEISVGIERVRPEQRAKRLAKQFSALRRRFATKLFAFDEASALAYGEIVGAASRRGATVPMADGMIASVALVNGGRLATRNVSDFARLGLDLINPWQLTA